MRIFTPDEGSFKNVSIRNNWCKYEHFMVSYGDDSSLSPIKNFALSSYFCKSVPMHWEK